MAASMSHLLTHRHVLLLQGKMGGFFDRFSTFLQTQNIQVSKVNFNAGDAFFIAILIRMNTRVLWRTFHLGCRFLLLSIILMRLYVLVTVARIIRKRPVSVKN